MNDLISRRDAIAVIENRKPLFTTLEYVQGINNGLTEAQSILRELPAADPVKHGKWIEQVVTGSLNDWYSCSNCGYYEIRAGRTLYCPNCGAKMEVEHEL